MVIAAIDDENFGGGALEGPSRGYPTEPASQDDNTSCPHVVDPRGGNLKLPPATSGGQATRDHVLPPIR